MMGLGVRSLRGVYERSPNGEVSHFVIYIEISD